MENKWQFAPFWNREPPLVLSEVDVDELKDVNSFFINGDDGMSYLILSMSFRNDHKETLLYKIASTLNKKGEERPYLFDHFKIADHFFSDNTLRERIYISSMFDKERVFFDSRTDRNLSGEDYKKKYENSGAHLDLVRSTSEEQLVHGYLAPLEQIAVVEKGLHYMRFDDSQVKDKSTGLYSLKGPIGKEKVEHILGELLYNSDKSYIWGQVNVRHALFSNVRAKILVLDEKGLGGVDGTKLYLVLQQNNSSHFFIRKLRFPNRLPAQDIKWVKMFTMEHSHYIGLALAAEDGYVYSASLELEKSHEDNIQLRTEDDPVLRITFRSGKDWDKDEINSRVFFDKLKGIPIWKEHPQLSFEEQSLQSFDADRYRPSKKGELLPVLDGNDIEERRQRVAMDATRWLIERKSIMRDLDITDRFSGKDHRKYQIPLFTQLEEFLDKIARQEDGPRHTFLLVPDVLKEYINKVVLSKYIETKNKSGWNFNNKNLNLFLFPSHTMEENRLRLLEENDKNKKVSLGFGSNLSSSVTDRLFAPKVRDMPANQLTFTSILSNIKRQFSSKGTNVLYSDIRDVERLYDDIIEREAVEEGDFEILTSVSSKGGMGVDAALGEVEEMREKKIPHPIYFLATEGESLLPEDLKNKIPSYNQIIISSYSEWKNLTGIDLDSMEEGQTKIGQSLAVEDSKASIEFSLGLKDRFHLYRLEPPNEEVQRRMFLNVFEDKALKGIYTYSFNNNTSQENLSQAEILDKLIGYLIKRLEFLILENKKDYFETFLTFSNVLKETLLSDVKLRGKGVFNTKAIEKVFLKVFSMPLNLEILDRKDPLVKLKSDTILIDIQEKGGYEGPFEITQQIIDALLSQLRASDILSVPASIILYGETGSGKTGLFTALMKTLEIPIFKYVKSVGGMVNKEKDGGPHFPGPQAFVLEGSSITSLGDWVKAQRSLEQFLTFDYGYRSFILLDDAHLISSTVRNEVFNYLREFIGGGDGGGTLRFRTGDSKEVELPVRNISLFMTLNPTDDQSKIRKRQGYSNKPPTDEDRILATLSVEDDFGKSFLRRWGLMLNLEEAPSEAKAPALVKRIASESRQKFLQGFFTAVSPRVIEDMASHEFGKMDLRSFLLNGANILSHFDGQKNILDDETFKILVKHTSESERRSSKFPNNLQRQFQRVDSGAEIHKYISKNIVALPMGSREGKLRFLELIIDKFRMNLMLNFVNYLRRSPAFMGSFLDRWNHLSWMEQAIYDHFKKGRRYLPLSQIALDASDFGAKVDQERKEFYAFLESLDSSEGAFNPSIFSEAKLSQDSFLSSIDHNYNPTLGLRRVQLNANHVKMILPYLNDFLFRSLRFYKEFELQGDKEGFPDIDQWIQNIEGMNNVSVHAEVSNFLVQALFGYMESLFDPRMLEMSSDQKVELMRTYDVARMYLLIIDKAITQMEWAPVLSFLLDGLKKTSADRTFNSSKPLHDFLFQNRDSLLRSATFDQLEQVLKNSESRKRITQAQSGESDERFIKKCGDMLLR